MYTKVELSEPRYHIFVNFFTIWFWNKCSLGQKDPHWHWDSTTDLWGGQPSAFLEMLVLHHYNIVFVSVAEIHVLLNKAQWFFSTLISGCSVSDRSDHDSCFIWTLVCQGKLTKNGEQIGLAHNYFWSLITCFSFKWHCNLTRIMQNSQKYHISWEHVFPKHIHFLALPHMIWVYILHNEDVLMAGIHH